MSISKNVTIFCDICNNWHDGKSAANVRADLRKQGWKTNLPNKQDSYNRQDICPVCWGRMTAEQQALSKQAANH